jgi:hypothetical protein
MLLNFTLINILKDYADAKGWVFLSGAEHYQNFEANQDIDVNTLILTADFTARPVYAGGRVVSISYDGRMMLGSKFEYKTDTDNEVIQNTTASYEELFFEKYTNRLKDLMQELSKVIGEISCENSYDVQNVTFNMELNKYSTQIDFVAAVITFKEGY